MKDKIVLALAGLPSMGNHGGAQTCYGIIQALRKQYDIHVISLYEPGQYSKDKKENEKLLNNLKIKISYINIKKNKKNNFFHKFYVLKDFIFPNIENYYKWIKYKNNLSFILDKIKPKFIICYHYEPLVAMYDLNYKIYPMFGDPTQKVIENISNNHLNYKKIWIKPFYKLFQKLKIIVLDKIFKKITKNCEKVFFFAAHYVKWSNTLGVKSYYIRTPLYDNFKKTSKKFKKFSILMIGDLSGTVTKSGLNFFFYKIYPNLIKKIDPRKFEVNIIGRNFKNYKKKYNFMNNINFLGRVEPADEYFLKSNMILTPNTIDLGIRVRIITAFGYGCPLVTHVSNKKGIPEIKNKYNALVANSSKKITRHIVEIYKNASIKKKISRNGKKTFKKYFAHKVFLHNFNKFIK